MASPPSWKDILGDSRRARRPICTESAPPAAADNNGGGEKMQQNSSSVSWKDVGPGTIVGQKSGDASWNDEAPVVVKKSGDASWKDEEPVVVKKSGDVRQKVAPLAKEDAYRALEQDDANRAQEEDEWQQQQQKPHASSQQDDANRAEEEDEWQQQQQKPHASSQQAWGDHNGDGWSPSKWDEYEKWDQSPADNNWKDQPPADSWKEGGGETWAARWGQEMSGDSESSAVADAWGNYSAFDVIKSAFGDDRGNFGTVKETSGDSESSTVVAPQSEELRSPADIIGRTCSGIVRRFREDRGWGHVTCEEIEDLEVITGRKDIFFMRNGLDVCGFVAEGDRIRYRITQGMKGLQAQDIDIISRGEGPESFEGRELVGTLKRHESKDIAFIDCAETKQVYGRDVFVGKAELAQSGLSTADTGTSVRFQIIVGADGRIKAKEIFPSSGTSVGDVGGQKKDGLFPFRDARGDKWFAFQ